jgi:flagellar motor switch protein FliG
MSETPQSDVAPVDRAAILLLALGEADAAKVLRHMDPKEVQRVGAAMAELGSLTTNRITQVVDDFLTVVGDQTGLAVGTSEYLRKMLTGALGEEKARVILERIVGGSTGGLDKLRWMDPRSIADFIADEHPQIQAIVLSYLEADQAAEVLDFIDDPKTRADLLIRVATLDSIPPHALQELSVVLEQQVSRRPATRFAQLGGPRTAAEIMNHLNSAQDETLMDNLRERDEPLSERIQELMFVFDNLNSVDDRGIQTLLREVSTDQLVLALKGADEVLREKIFRNMSKRAAELLKDDMDAKGPVRISEVEAAQKDILSVARKLADSGEIMLGGSGEEML